MLKRQLQSRKKSCKQIILIASVLKPIDEVRMYKKIAQTLAQEMDFEVHIFSQGNNSLMDPLIHFHPLRPFSRSNLRRLWSPWKCLILMVKLKPKIYIATTYELLIVMILYKILFGGIFVYDVQENYFENLKNSPMMGSFLKSILGRTIRLIEKISSSYVNHFLLAERCYLKELSFIPIERTVVIENLYEGNIVSRKNQLLSQPITMILSGTLSPYYGTLEAIKFIVTLNSKGLQANLLLVGFTPQESFYNQLFQLVKPHKFINLIADTKPISYKEILTHIKIADIGLLSYPPNSYTKDRIPTKLYEYLANGLPIIINNNQLWHSICQKYEASINLDFKNFNFEEFSKQLYNKQFYSSTPEEEILWVSQKKTLIRLFNKYNT